jgi:hypothetical protein
VRLHLDDTDTVDGSTRSALSILVSAVRTRHKAAIEGGASIEDAAEFLCRSGSIDDVARKAHELGLKPKPKS